MGVAFLVFAFVFCFVFHFDSLRSMYLNNLFEDACSGLPEIVQYASFVRLYLTRSLSLATAITLSCAPADK